MGASDTHTLPGGKRRLAVGAATGAVADAVRILRLGDPRRGYR